MPFTLPDLPYDPAAFGDTLSAESFTYHHGKHHKAYVDKTNAAVSEMGLAGHSLVDVIGSAHGQADKASKGLFNNSAQLWNHSFFWQCLSPGGGTPAGALAERIDADFGSYDAMAKAFSDEAIAHFGSGWAWLVLDGDTLKIKSLHDADTPVVHDLKPLLTVDVWEHAYYIDYRNARPDYIKALLADAINWDFVAQNLDGKGASRADQPG
jgi:superoxide dismutase, Fe-Mn family